MCVQVHTHTPCSTKPIPMPQEFIWSCRVLPQTLPRTPSHLTTAHALPDSAFAPVTLMFLLHLRCAFSFHFSLPRICLTFKFTFRTFFLILYDRTPISLLGRDFLQPQSKARDPPGAVPVLTHPCIQVQ